MDWAQKLICQDEAAFSSAGFLFSIQADIPAQIRVQKISDQVATNMIKERMDPLDPDCRRVSLKHAVQVAQEADLHYKKGDIFALERGIGSSKQFAAKVLRAVDSSNTNKVQDLLKRKVRRDSFEVTNLSQRLTEFL